MENKTIDECCQFSEQGCKYRNKDESLLDKHHKWLCEYKTRCGVCKAKLNRTSEIGHHFIQHCKPMEESEKDWFTTSFDIHNPITLRKTTCYSVKAHNNIFLVTLLFQRGKITVQLISSTEDYGMKYFICKCRIVADSSAFCRKDSYVMKPIEKNWQDSDWEATIITNKFIPAQVVQAFEINIVDPNVVIDIDDTTDDLQ